MMSEVNRSTLGPEVNNGNNDLVSELEGLELPGMDLDDEDEDFDDYGRESDIQMVQKKPSPKRQGNKNKRRSVPQDHHEESKVEEGPAAQYSD